MKSDTDWAEEFWLNYAEATGDNAIEDFVRRIQADALKWAADEVSKARFGETKDLRSIAFAINTKAEELDQ